jgi:glutamine amidotransferase
VKVAIVSYGIGNLASVQRAFEDAGTDAYLANDPTQLDDAERIVLPGVGAFGEAMNRLRAGGWPDALYRLVVEKVTPVLGICLGMQMLGTSSDENGVHEGLGLIPGRVVRLEELGCSLRVPHMGWNDVTQSQKSSLFDGIPSGTDFYFVHSYALVTDDPAATVATTSYGVEITAAVRSGHCFGTQFHPEKSSKAGRRLIQNFLDHARC